MSGRCYSNLHCLGETAVYHKSIDYAEHFMSIPFVANDESQYTGNDLVFHLFIKQTVQEQPGDRAE